MSEGLYPSDTRGLAKKRRELVPETEAAFQEFGQSPIHPLGALPFGGMPSTGTFSKRAASNDKGGVSFSTAN